MTSKRHRYGFSVTVFLPTGDPEGIKVVEKSNWSGRGLVIPRSIFLESRDRSELESTGVPYEMQVYSGAPHAFTVFGSKRYREVADTQSWDAFSDFLKTNLN